MDCPKKKWFGVSLCCRLRVPDVCQHCNAKMRACGPQQPVHATRRGDTNLYMRPIHTHRMQSRVTKNEGLNKKCLSSTPTQ
eukprot:361767-Chlamydomonas_euryale.AAC.10